jgi:hypothetical protein
MATTKSSNSSGTLTTYYSEAAGWRVQDSNGGVWWPSSEAEDLIDAEPEARRARKAMELCQYAPTMGFWTN